MNRRNILLTLSLAVGWSVATVAAAADISGKWKLVWDTEGGIRHTQWTIAQEGTAVKIDADGQALAGTFEENRLVVEGKFHSPEAGYSSTLRAEGTLKDGEMRGKGTWDQYSMTFVATRAE